VKPTFLSPHDLEQCVHHQNLDTIRLTLELWIEDCLNVITKIWSRQLSSFVETVGYVCLSPTSNQPGTARNAVGIPSINKKKKERDAEIRKVIRVKGKKDEKKETT
jgi:hypothetical protein